LTLPNRALRGIDYNQSLLIKGWLTNHPVLGLGAGLVFFITINAYLLYLAERGNEFHFLSCYDDSRIYGATTYRNAIWLTIITFLTVGYGDYFPTTMLGRYIAIVTVMGGLLYSATIIGLIHGALALTSEEAGVLSLISNNRKQKQKV